MNAQKKGHMHVCKQTGIFKSILESSQHELYKHGNLTLTALLTELFSFFNLKESWGYTEAHLQNTLV